MGLLKRGLTRLYTGEGQGKSTAALGVALRAYGHGLRVNIIHFLKGYEDVGEMWFAKRAGVNWTERMFRHTKSPYIDLTQILENKGEHEFACWEAYRSIVEAYLKSDIVVLDEVTNAEAAGVLPLDLVLTAIDQKPAEVELILTGRMAHPQIVTRCDYVTEMVKVRHPYDKGIWARKGVDY